MVICSPSFITALYELCPKSTLLTDSKQVLSIFTGKVTQLSILEQVNMQTKKLLIFECAVDGHCSPTMHCTKEMEELLTAGLN